MASTRRLAAILAADVAGYSRLMGADEEGTLAELKAIRRASPGSSSPRCKPLKSGGRPLGLPMTSLPTICTFALLAQFAQGNGARNGIFRVSTS
jgi:hypothetical protein